MSITQNNGVCPAILVGIEQVLKSGANPQKFNTKVGLLQSLHDPDNREGVTMKQLGEGDQGHRKTVRIAHRKRAIKSDTTTSKDCGDGTEKPFFEETFDVNQHRQHIIRVTEESIRELCDAYSEYQNAGDAATGPLQLMKKFAEDLMADMNAMREAVNSDLHDSAVLNIGNYYGGTDSSASPQTLDVIVGATHAPVFKGFNLMKQEMRKIGASVNPIIVGASTMDLAIMSLGYGCCNDGGTDFGMMRQDIGFKFYQDYEADLADIYGDADDILAYLAKTLQFVQYNKYVGSFARPIGTMQRGTIPDPVVPGLRYDFRLKPSECDELYDLYLNLDFDLYASPSSLFKSGDNLEGVNGVVKFRANATE